MMILFAWVLAFLVCFPPVLTGLPSVLAVKAENASKITCQCTPLNYSPQYIVFSSMFSFYIPMIIICALYVRIYAVARDVSRRISQGYLKVRESVAQPKPNRDGPKGTNSLPQRLQQTPEPLRDALRIHSRKSMLAEKRISEGQINIPNSDQLRHKRIFMRRQNTDICMSIYKRKFAEVMVDQTKIAHASAGIDQKTSER